MVDLPQILLATFGIIWSILAIKPVDRKTWWLESVVLFVALPFVLWAFHAGHLSMTSSVIIFIFATLHVAAARYSYAKTPWGNWFKKAGGFRRNEYDRIVHFLYGLMMVPVVIDIFRYQLPPGNFVGRLFVFGIIVTFGSLYELGEFAAAFVLGKGRTTRFLGTQGDVWDTQKDILMQVIGALLGLLIFRNF